MNITLKQADAVITETLNEARKNKVKPLAVIVLDTGGHPVAFRREDKVSLFRHDIAKAKAMSALGMGSDTKVLTERATNNPVFFNSLSAVTNGNIVFAPGGVLIKNNDSENIGAVGISGDSGEVDEVCALAGISAAGLQHGDSQ